MILSIWRSRRNGVWVGVRVNPGSQESLAHRSISVLMRSCGGTLLTLAAVLGQVYYEEMDDVRILLELWQDSCN